MSIFTNRRTVRKFKKTEIEDEKLIRIVDAARLAPYPSNIQPIKFMIIKDKADAVFEYTRWAGYLTDGAPKENERPFAFVALLGDTQIKKNGNFACEAATAGATICLAAEQEKVGACWLGAINRDGIRKALGIPDEYTIEYLVALGIPAMKSKSVSYKDSFKYYLDDTGELCVPKLGLSDVLLKID